MRHSRGRTEWSVAAAPMCVAIALFVFSGCGGEDSAPATDEGLPENESLEPTTSLEQLIKSDAYAGHLVVHFDEGLAVRQDRNTKALVARTSGDDRLKSIEGIIASIPRAQLVRAIEAPPEKLDERRRDLERLSGKKLADWNSIYHVDVRDPDEAIELLRALKNEPGITKVYPALVPVPTSLATTPDLSGWQTYLLPEATHGGLNAAAAHSQGITGAGIYIVDHESGVNPAHEDLDLIAAGSDDGGCFLTAPDCAPGFPPLVSNCASRISHGTAVAGILVANSNGHGVTGFAPDATYLLAAADALAGVTNGIDEAWTNGDDDLEPGGVWVIEYSLPGIFSDPNAQGAIGDAQAQFGQVPTELWPEAFAAIQQATAYGITVVAGAGNGQMDLNNPNLYVGDYSFAHNLAVEDAGSIMVGASEGANKQRAFFSNCGARVNAFAWGQGVVTTGRPVNGSLWSTWNGAAAPKPANDLNDPNNFYIDSFGGTSSAAAMVGGAVALVQSRARALLEHKRYIMPVRMRELVVNSGVSQVGGGCNIGKQPRIDIALASASTLVDQAKAAYPQLVNDQPRLTEQQMIALRQMGVGIICKKFDPAGSDPICPDAAIYPAGSGIAKAYDFDGDGRSDLVSWTNGTWKIDLSGHGPGGDNFGAWDIEINHPPIEGQWVWPFVADMNSDKRTDFVVYDKEHGRFFIAYTDTALLTNGTWHGWDRVVDYSAVWHDDLQLDPAQSHYSRPMLADYNNDGWTDLSIACSDGIWRTEFGGPNQNALNGAFDLSVQYLTPAMLAAAPGWAYPVANNYVSPLGGEPILLIKVPDGLPDAGRLLFESSFIEPGIDQIELTGTTVPHMFGGNDEIIVTGDITAPGLFSSGMTLKDSAGGWKVFHTGETDYYLPPVSLPPSGKFGGNECHPLIGYFGGSEWDDHQDRAVMCPDGWRIAYSDTATWGPLLNADGLRIVPLGYDASTFTLPGRSYSGGISYAYVQQIMQFFQQTHPGVPPPIPVDMVTFH